MPIGPGAEAGVLIPPVDSVSIISFPAETLGTLESGHAPQDPFSFVVPTEDTGFAFTDSGPLSFSSIGVCGLKVGMMGSPDPVAGRCGARKVRSKLLFT